MNCIHTTDGEHFAGEEAAGLDALAAAHARTRVLGVTRRGWLAVDPAAMGGALGLGYALTVHKA
jgi:streptomycin 6-kinase